MYFFATDKTVFKETVNATAPLSPRQIDKFAQLLVAVMQLFFPAACSSHRMGTNSAATGDTSPCRYCMTVRVIASPNSSIISEPTRSA